MGHSPFFLNHGRHPNKGLEPCHEVKSQVAQDFVDNLTKARTKAQAMLTKAAEMMKTFYDKKQVDTRNYDKGDSLVGRIQHYHDVTQQEVGRKTI